MESPFLRKTFSHAFCTIVFYAVNIVGTIFVIYCFLFCQAELATLVGGSGNRKPPARKKPEVDLDAMVSE